MYISLGSVYLSAKDPANKFISYTNPIVVREKIVNSFNEISKTLKQKVDMDYVIMNIITQYSHEYRFSEHRVILMNITIIVT